MNTKRNLLSASKTYALSLNQNNQEKCSTLLRDNMSTKFVKQRRTLAHNIISTPMSANRVWYLWIDYYEVNAEMIKGIADYMTDPLTLLFNNCIEPGQPSIR